jgi:hypothetical protein
LHAPFQSRKSTCGVDLPATTRGYQNTSQLIALDATPQWAAPRRPSGQHRPAQVLAARANQNGPPDEAVHPSPNRQEHRHVTHSTTDRTGPVPIVVSPVRGLPRSVGAVADDD